MSNAIQRALLSLNGLSVGDALGERFFVPNKEALNKIEARELPKAPLWPYTDDTEMAISIVQTLREKGEIEPDFLAQKFIENFHENRGYGRSTVNLLKRLSSGASWKNESSKVFGGAGSYGNGSAMRVAPIGAFFAEDLQATKRNAVQSSIVTHTHNEAINGAIAVAIATALAWQYRDSISSHSAKDFMKAILPFLSESETKKGIQTAIELPENTSAEKASEILGSGSKISSQDTVPFVIWVASHHLNSYRDAIWTTLEGLGDRDTTCAMVGGIVAMSDPHGIPNEWLARREELPDFIKF